MRSYIAFTFLLPSWFQKRVRSNRSVCNQLKALTVQEINSCLIHDLEVEGWQWLWLLVHIWCCWCQSLGRSIRWRVFGEYFLCLIDRSEWLTGMIGVAWELFVVIWDKKGVAWVCWVKWVWEFVVWGGFVIKDCPDDFVFYKFRALL